MTARLDGKVAFITGAARGQGRSHAVRLAEAGADIIAIDICADIPGLLYPSATEDDLKETVRLVQGLGRRIVAAPADVRDGAELKQALDRGVEQLGRLDIVSANAGVATVARKAQDLPEEIWNDMIDINLSGVWRTAKVAIPHLLAGGRGGAIVLTSSVAGLKGYENLAHYVASKHGVVGLMRTLAVELARDGIRVNSIHPAQVDTPMIMNDATYKLFLPGASDPSREQFAVASQAMNALPIPWLDPLDISNALLFLVSDDARYITGVALPIDAGVMIR
jgi:SDR family mycofactocin-dependent oxidoreductase